MDINELRKEIDAVDREMVELIARRMEIAAKISDYKRKRGLPVLDMAREKEKLDSVAALAGEKMGEYTRRVFTALMDVSKDYQVALMEKNADRFGLIGEKLGHSYSPRIHSLLCGYDYSLYEVERGTLESFLRDTGLKGMNVTMPYKKDVVPLCTWLSDTARRTGSVNTLVRREDGWHGYNTDYDGFMHTVKASGCEVQGKKTLVLGNGGVSPTVCAVLEDMGGCVTVISRSGGNNYANLQKHADAQIIVNATPVGMYPNNGSSLVQLEQFPECEAVFDLIYNPRLSAMLLQAEARGLLWANGLDMLACQAARSAEIFTGKAISEERIGEIRRILERESSNIILIGMPGCGKSAVGKAVAKATGRKFYDADSEICAEAGQSIPEIFAKNGERGFRELETAVLSRLGKLSGCVIATGGGCVTVPKNYELLHQNGVIIWLERELDALPVDGRPLSQSNPLAALYEERKDKYEFFSDFRVDNSGGIDTAAEKIAELTK